MVPLIALWGYTVWEQYQARVSQAEEGVLSLATAHADQVQRSMADIRVALRELVADPSWREQDEAGCHRHLTGFRNLLPNVAEFSAFGPDGTLVCSSVSILGDVRFDEVPERRAFVSRVLESPGVHYGPPRRGAVTGRVAMVMGEAVPRGNPGGSPHGAVVAAVEVSRLQELLGTGPFPDGTVVTLIRAQDRMIVSRSHDGEAWVGRTLEWDGATASDLLRGSGLVRAEGQDSIHRIWGHAPVTGPDWVVFVGIPEDSVYGPIRAAMVRQGGGALAVLLFVGLLTGSFYRSIGSAVNGVTADAQVAARDPDFRIGSRGFWELDRLAEEFNRTLAARARAERELVRAERELQEARRMEAVGDLAAGVAHEFNNILTVIRMEASFIREDLEHGGLGTAGAVQIERASDRAATMVSRLLALGRRDPARPQWMDPCAAVQGLVAGYREEFGDRLHIELELAPDVPRIHLDPNHLDQVFWNLVRNSWDALPDGGKVVISLARGSMTVGDGERRDGLGGTPIAPDPRDQAPTCVIQVSDTGPGMSAEVRRRAFDPFFTTRPQGEGTGLGLPTVHGIATRAGGGVRLLNRPGGGTTVEVTFPGAYQPDQDQ